MKNIILILSILITILILTNCGDNAVTSNRDVVFPDSNVSYIHHIEPFLMLKCSYQGCHNAETRAADRDMSSYHALFETSNAGLIIAGNPNGSRMMQILKGNPQHNGYYSFPAGYFKDNYVKGMETWIKEGAKFN